MGDLDSDIASYLGVNNQLNDLQDIKYSVYSYVDANAGNCSYCRL